MAIMNLHGDAKFLGHTGGIEKGISSIVLNPNLESSNVAACRLLNWHIGIDDIVMYPSDNFSLYVGKYQY